MIPAGSQKLLQISIEINYLMDVLRWLENTQFPSIHIYCRYSVV